MFSQILAHIFLIVHFTKMLVNLALILAYHYGALT